MTGQKISPLHYIIINPVGLQSCDASVTEITCLFAGERDRTNSPPEWYLG